MQDVAPSTPYYLDAFTAACRSAFIDRDGNALALLSALLAAAPRAPWEPPAGAAGEASGNGRGAEVVVVDADAGAPSVVLRPPFVDAAGRLIVVDDATWAAMERIRSSVRAESHAARAALQRRALQDGLAEASLAEPWAAARHRHGATRDAAATLVDRAAGAGSLTAAMPAVGALFVALDTALATSQGVVLYLPDVALLEAGDAAWVRDWLRFLRHTLGCEAGAGEVDGSGGAHRPWRVGVPLSDATITAALVALPAPRRTTRPTMSSHGRSAWLPPAAVAAAAHAAATRAKATDVEAGGGNDDSATTTAAAAEHLQHLDQLADAVPRAATFPFRASLAASPRYRAWAAQLRRERRRAAAAVDAAVADVAVPGAVVLCGSVRANAAGATDADALPEPAVGRGIWPCPSRTRA